MLRIKVCSVTGACHAVSIRAVQTCSSVPASFDALQRSPPTLGCESRATPELSRSLWALGSRVCAPCSLCGPAGDVDARKPPTRRHHILRRAPCLWLPMMDLAHAFPPIHGE